MCVCGGGDWVGTEVRQVANNLHWNCPLDHQTPIQSWPRTVEAHPDPPHQPCSHSLSYKTDKTTLLVC